MEQHQVYDLIKQSQNELLDQMTQVMDSKLCSFQQNISENQKTLSDIQVAKIELISTEAYKFNKKGNEEQYKINAKVSKSLKEAEAALKDHKPDDAMERISQGIEIIEHRQNLIKLADSSEMGWRTVAEYETRTLADDSDDEKRMLRAESRAQRKYKLRTRNSRASYNRTHPYSQAPEVRNTSETKQSAGVRHRPGTCFQCGKPGHWRFECKEGSRRTDDKVDKISMNFYVNDVEENKADCRAAKVSSEMNTLVGVLSPVARLREAYDKWVQLGASDAVLSIIKDGHKLPFFTLPGDIALPNNKSARENCVFVEEEIDRLLQKGCISELAERPRVVNPLTVAGNKEKLRLVLDCRHINPHLFKYKFKYEDQSLAKDLFKQGDFIFGFDLKSAYHHIEIFDQHRSFLGFAWDYADCRRYFSFNVLPFGISTAGYIFTKVTRVLVKYWRSQGEKIIMFLDDGMGGASDLDHAIQFSLKVQEDLHSLGFLIAQEKCSWIPQTKLIWLGLEWHMEQGKVYTTEKRINKLLNSIDGIRNKMGSQMLISARQLAGMAGQVISMQTAIGKICQLKTRGLYACINTRAGWDAPVVVSETALSEIEFWAKNIRRLNGISFHDMLECTYTVFSDASGYGYGGFIVESDDSEVVGKWSETEAEKSSTWRELETVRRVLKSSEASLEGHSVQWYTDNKNVVSIIEKGSKHQYLQEVALQIQECCDTYRIGIKPVWVSRKENVQADSLSRCADSDDWSIDQRIFEMLDVEWGLSLREVVTTELCNAGAVSAGMESLGENMVAHLLHSKSESTNAKYFGAFWRWREFITQEGACALPGAPIHVALYFTKLIDKKLSFNSVQAAYYGIKWAHKMCNFVDPTNNSFVISLLESAKRQNSTPVVKKDILTSDQIISLCEKYESSNDVLVLRDLVMIVLSFAGFLRFDEVSSLRCSDIEFTDNYISVHIAKSKTDQYRKGSTVLISKGTTAACPVNLLLRYISEANVDVSSTDFLFKPCFRSRQGCSLIYKNKPISYTRAREVIIARLKEVCGSSVNLGLHSMRAGGASMAARSAVNERCWKRHGRWKCDKSKDGYVEDTVEKRLEVSQSLQL